MAIIRQRRPAQLGSARMGASRGWFAERSELHGPADTMTPWTGGDAPTSGAVAVRRRDGRTVELPKGCAVDWAHTQAASDIVAWREIDA